MSDEIIIDEFTLLNHIATGSSTQVWEAVEKGGGDRHYAMKLMLPEALSQSEHRSVLKHEAKLSERFDHPNLVRFNKLVMNKKRGYMVVDYFRAPNLKMQLQADGISLQVRLGRLFEQLCQVLGYLHDLGWVHRDVKPDNILFNKASELRLIDFSLTTKAAGAVSKLMGSKEKVIQGTRTYISPETILKAPPAPQSDIYSLGITVFEVLTGEPPFRGTSPDDLLKKHLTSPVPPPSSFNPNVTPEMDKFVMKMLSKRVKDRHKNTNELMAEFRNIKPFKEDAGEHDRRLKAELEEKYKHTLDKSGRLDSRADHLQQKLFKENPELAKLAAEKRKKEAAEDAEKKKTIAAKLAKKAAEEKLALAKPKGGRSAAASPPPPPPQVAMPPQPPPMPSYPRRTDIPAICRPHIPWRATDQVPATHRCLLVITSRLAIPERQPIPQPATRRPDIHRAAIPAPRHLYRSLRLRPKCRGRRCRDNAPRRPTTPRGLPDRNLEFRTEAKCACRRDRRPSRPVHHQPNGRLWAVRPSMPCPRRRSRTSSSYCNK